MALPTITIEGRVANDPALRYTPTGKGVINVRVVSSERVKNQAGEYEDGERSPFVNVTLWEKDAEALADSVHKGDRVLVTGRLFEREFEHNGEKRTSLEVKHGTVALVPGGRPAERQSQPPADDPWGSV